MAYKLTYIGVGKNRRRSLVYYANASRKKSRRLSSMAARLGEQAPPKAPTPGRAFSTRGVRECARRVRQVLHLRNKWTREGRRDLLEQAP